jgi:hypothetical protein
MVGVRKAIWQHGQALARAAVILQEEHGKRHAPGERCDLCPTCQREKAESRTANASVRGGAAAPYPARSVGQEVAP